MVNSIKVSVTLRLPPTDPDLQLSHLNTTMDMMINFVPNLFAVLGEDAEDKELVEKHVGDLRTKLAKLITQVYYQEFKW